MASCRIVNTAVETAVTNIADVATALKTAGENFLTAFNSALAPMEGATKDALVDFVKKNVEEFVTTGVYNAVNGMSQQLEANRSSFVDVDAQIANSINGN